MGIIENSTITSVVISCELFMYGTITLSIEKSDDGINTFWLGASDGGMYVEEGNQSYPGKCFEELLRIILSVKKPEEKVDEFFNWSISVQNDHDGCFLFEVDQWGRDLFDSIIAMIEDFLGDGKSTEMFNNML